MSKRDYAYIITNEIMSLFHEYGNREYYGEPVSQLEHMYQCGELAREFAADENDLILAAFLHDIGHLCVNLPSYHEYVITDYGVIDHDIIGAKYLSEKGFSNKVIILVSGHVQAKRYLAYKLPEYLSNLSPASLITLKEQGGPMSNDEASKFEKHSMFQNFLQLRRWDEQAKVPGLPLSNIPFYSNLIFSHLLINI